MCFSPTASFATGFILIPAGLYCLQEIGENQREYIPIAAWPFCFGIQQLFEGLLWLGIESNQLIQIQIGSFVFLFFSHLFWLFWTPITAYFVETNKLIKQILTVFILLGLLYGLLLYIPLWSTNNLLEINIINHSISYKTKFIWDEFLPRNLNFWIYAFIILGSLFISSNRSLNYLGALLFFSVLATYLAFSYAFISVWCFFAALISIYLVYTVHKVVRINSREI